MDVNDLPNNLKCSIGLVADDALLYGIISRDVEGDQLQEDLKKLEAWQSNWHLWSRAGASCLYFLSRGNPEKQLEVVESRLIHLW